MLDLFMLYKFIVKKETCFNTGEVMSWQDTFCQIFIFISEQVCPVSGQFLTRVTKVVTVSVTTNTNFWSDWTRNRPP